MTEQIVLIVNPAATRAGPHLRTSAVAALSPLGLMRVIETTRAHGGRELAAAASAEGATVVVAMGGDGTVNEVACGLAGTTTALAPLPAGSTNVFARALGWPHPARLALPALITALGTPTFRDVTLGRIEAGGTDRAFCVNAGIGVAADTIHLVESRPWLKTRFRHVGVGGATVVAAARAARRDTTMTVTIDAEAPRTLATLLVACGAPYAYLGPRPLDLVPGAAFDGRLRWVGLHSSGFARTARVVAGALRDGTHLRRDDVTDGWAARQIVVSCDRPLAVQADGEPLGWHTHVRMSPGPTVRALVPTARETSGE